MSLEQSISELAAAIRMLAAAQAGAVTVTSDAPQSEDKPRRGRPPKNTTEPAAQDVPPVTAPAVETPAAAPVSAGPVAAAGDSPPPDKGSVQKALIALVQTKGKAACTDLCLKYGAPNLSAIDSAKWGALLAEANALLAA